MNFDLNNLPTTAVTVNCDSDTALAAIHQLHHRMADQLQQEVASTSNTAAYMVFSGHPTHHIVCAFFSPIGFPDDSGWMVIAYPKSMFTIARVWDEVRARMDSGAQRRDWN